MERAQGARFLGKDANWWAGIGRKIGQQKRNLAEMCQKAHATLVRAFLNG